MHRRRLGTVVIDCQTGRRERQIRAEYAFVPGVTFKARRRTVLAAFLARERIYGTPRLHDEIEPAARGNLARAMDAHG